MVFLDYVLLNPVLAFSSLIKIAPFLPTPLRERFFRSFWRNFWNSEVASEANNQEISGSERATLIEAIASFGQIDSLLELGCGFGQNFFSLARLYPHAHFAGVDIDPSRIDSAKTLLSQSFPPVRFELQTLDVLSDLSRFPDKSFECVISSAFLLYVNANNIEGVIREMIRIARRGVVLLEQHRENPYFEDQHRGVLVPGNSGRPGYWIRDYQKLLAGVIGSGNIQIIPIRNSRWDLEQWSSLGKVISVRL